MEKRGKPVVLLAKHPGKTFSRYKLLKLIWGASFSRYEHTITSPINRLRIKIETNLHHPEYILTAGEQVIDLQNKKVVF